MLKYPGGMWHSGWQVNTIIDVSCFFCFFPSYINYNHGARAYGAWTFCVRRWRHKEGNMKPEQMMANHLDISNLFWGTSEISAAEKQITATRAGAQIPLKWKRHSCLFSTRLSCRTSETPIWKRLWQVKGIAPRRFFFPQDCRSTGAGRGCWTSNLSAPSITLISSGHLRGFCFSFFSPCRAFWKKNKKNKN